MCKFTSTANSSKFCRNAIILTVVRRDWIEGQNALNCNSSRFPFNGEKKDYCRGETKDVLMPECWIVVRCM